MKTVTTYIDDAGNSHASEREAKKADARIYLRKKMAENSAAPGSFDVDPDEFIRALEKDQVNARRHVCNLFNIET